MVSVAHDTAPRAIVPFGKLYAFAMDMDLSPQALLTYAYLVHISGRKGYCFPSIQTIASKLRLSRRAVARAIAELEQAGIITRERTGRSNNYTITPDADTARILASAIGQQGHIREASRDTSDRPLATSDRPAGTHKPDSSLRLQPETENQSAPPSLAEPEWPACVGCGERHAPGAGAGRFCDADRYVPPWRRAESPPEPR